ncbi:MAG: deoxynucleoside kinase [Phycisphaerae bacterium]|nr:deoxynucleoside kinase [Phycisphaerae bacterium]
MPVTCALVSVIGPPAVGKTTLAERLAAELPAELIREDYGGNPFLAEAYAGVAQARLPSQLYFLMSRVGQLALLGWPGGGVRVTDYGFCQDRIFAGSTLSADDWTVYDRTASRLDRLVKPPEVLIHLDADEATLLARMAARGRAHERFITAEFLAALRRSYTQAADQADCKVLRVDAAGTDLRNALTCAPLIEQVRSALAAAGR